MRFKGLRLIHTHLNGENLSDEDMTDLSHLRLDLIGALDVREDGSPGLLHWAHLVPENPAGDYWLFMKPEEPHQIKINFLSFIQALEDEFAKKQQSRKIDATNKAILLRVEKNPLAGAEASLEELAQLAHTCGVEVFDSMIQYRPQPDPRFMVGRGKLSAIDLRASQIGANMLIFDHDLTPAQARSISDFTGLKIIDRTQLILDIFARRAHSREGKIQVELAQLKYRLPRLTHADTSLSRLAGGIGGTGPGETKLEIDRRRVRERIHRLEKDLKSITKSRRQRYGRREKNRIADYFHRRLYQRGQVHIAQHADAQFRPGGRQTVCDTRHEKRASAFSPGHGSHHHRHGGIYPRSSGRTIRRLPRDA